MHDDLILEIPSDPRAIEHAVELVVRRCAHSEYCRRKLELNFRVGLMEALANAVLYGNREDPRKHIRLEVAFMRHAIEARVTDQGPGFDPGEVPDPTTPENIERSGGRGLFLMRKLMDEVRYNDTGNSVTLVLHLERPERLDDAASA